LSGRKVYKGEVAINRIQVIHGFEGYDIRVLEVFLKCR